MITAILLLIVAILIFGAAAMRNALGYAAALAIGFVALTVLPVVFEKLTNQSGYGCIELAIQFDLDPNFTSSAFTKCLENGSFAEGLRNMPNEQLVRYEAARVHAGKAVRSEQVSEGTDEQILEVLEGGDLRPNAQSLDAARRAMDVFGCTLSDFRLSSGWTRSVGSSNRFYVNCAGSNRVYWNSDSGELSAL